MSLTLAQYLSRTKQLLQNPSAQTQLYTDANLTDWINIGRGQVAGESESIRYLAAVDTVAAQRKYNLVDLDTGDATINGIGGVLKVNSIMYGVGDGFLPMSPQAWEWFQTYKMAKAVPDTGAPEEWAQYGQGSTGNFYIDPIPDVVYTLTCDTVCFPTDLDGTDDEVDAIPKYWDDAVPYFAAYLALLSAQTQQRSADANMMMERYGFFVDRARQFSNPRQAEYLYSQAKDETLPNKLGGGPRPAGGQ